MALPWKPHIVQDIRPKRGTASPVSARPLVNLSYDRSAQPRSRGVRLTSRRVMRFGFGLAGILFLIIGSVSAPTNQTLAQTSTSDERAALEAQLAQLQKEMDAAAAQRDAASKQGKTLSGDITKLNSTISGLNAQIKAINASLSQLNDKIGLTQSQIEVTTASLEQNRAVLASLIQELYQSDRTSLLEIFLKNKQLSDFFTNVNNVTTLQDNVRATIGKISSLKDQLSAHEQELSATKNDVELTKEYQTAQQARVSQVKTEKSQLLAVTKGQEKLYQQIYAQKKAAADKIRARLFELLGGGQISFGAAYSFASVAANATGVRAALILAVLDRESALGRNVGRCDYQSAMSPANIPVFLSLVKTLNIDPATVKVSCAITADGAYGGAMGPAQFLPMTWMKYTDRISAITGHNPASPWNNGDAFVATALYLHDAGAVAGNTSSERAAAAKYYAGGNWSRFLYTYGQAVIDRAAQFEDDIATLNAAQQ